MYTKQQIIEEIRRIATNLNVKSLRQRDFNKHSKISLSTVRYHFGNWNDAVKEAGLIPIDPTEVIRKKELIDDDRLLLRRQLMRFSKVCFRHRLTQISNKECSIVR